MHNVIQKMYVIFGVFGWYYGILYLRISIKVSLRRNFYPYFFFNERKV